MEFTRSTLAFLVLLCHYRRVTCEGTFRSVYCLPGLECWPSARDLTIFASTLDGETYFPYQTQYDSLTIMKNTRVTKFPAFIVAVNTTSDVQKSVAFANKHKIRIAIQSSGHDYQGRSTAYSAMQIYFGKMTNIQVKLQSDRNKAGEITVESGAQWLDVYKEVDKYNRLIVGGSAHTVAIGGYTLGGGHSPMSRMFGLAVDNLLEVEMVTADGNIRIVQENTTWIIDKNKKVYMIEDLEKELFWAIRGGGGGTFGIVTKFTFRLHMPAPSVVLLSCNFMILDKSGSAAPGTSVLAKLATLILNMPNEWGGYIILTGFPAKDGSIGTIQLYMNHYGSWDTDTRLYMDDIVNFHPEWQRFCHYVNYSTFLEYEKTTEDAIYVSNYVSNTFVQDWSFNAGFIEFLIKNVLEFPENKSLISFTGVLIGGKTKNVGPDDTPLHPGFRRGYMSLTAGVGWDSKDFALNDKFTARGIKLGNDLREFGWGMYRNEASGSIADWKTEFWGNHYDRLLKVKQSIDPSNIFNCFDCIGGSPEESKHTNGASLLKSLFSNTYLLVAFGFIMIKL